MKVTIIVGGKFHAIGLAQQLQKYNMLYQFVTTYPKSKIIIHNINKDKLLTFSFIEYFKRGIHKLFGFYPFSFVLDNLFDKLSSIKVKKDADVYIIWSGMALHSIKKIRQVNPKAKIILTRGSTHIVEQNELLRKVTGEDVVDKRTIAKELKEYKEVDYIALLSKFTKDSFIKHNIEPEKLFVNPSGINLNLFRPIKSNNKTNKFNIGYAGIISARKNIKGIISAVKVLNIKTNNITLNLVGNVDKKTFSKELLNEEFIYYKPAVSQEQLIPFYNNLDVFIQNSVEEGLSSVILQALSCGIPVIATENSGGAEVIKNGYNGFLIPAFSETALIEKIEYMYNLSSKKKDVMKKNALESVQLGFTWERYGDKYVEFLNKIIK